MNILLWVIVAVSIALVCFAVAKQTGFNVPSLPSNKWVRRGLGALVVFCVVALIFPNVVGTITTNMVSWARDFNDNYGKAELASAQQSAPAVYQPETRVVEVLVTENEFTEVKIPPGVKFSIDCPDDGLAKVYHRDAQQGVIYDCAQTIEVGENLHNFRIGFSAKTEAPVKVVVRITS